MDEISDAVLAARLLAIDPVGLGGAIVFSEGRSAAEEWVNGFMALMPSSAPCRRIPANISDDRLLGGLDFAATLATGRAVAERGVLASANGGAVLLSSGTVRAGTWSHVARALDARAIAVERDGLTSSDEAEFAAIAIQTEGDDAPPAAFVDRVAFIVMATQKVQVSVPHDARDGMWVDRDDIARARELLPSVRISDAMLTALCEGAGAVGVESPRLALRAVAVARAHAALCGRSEGTSHDIATAARLVIAPRAQQRSESEPGRADIAEDSSGATADGRRDEATPPEGEGRNDSATVQELSDIVIRAAESALPPGLTTALAASRARASASAGRSGAEQVGTRGRQIGSRRGRPEAGARLDLIATLRAAAPMQRMRRATVTGRSNRLVELRRDDFRIRRCVSPSPTTTLFVVDVSGSSALHRLAEAKGAVELMLAEGYARRERVAVIAFRGTVASLVLPPTHALARARRAIAGMPAGGGTPLATALDLATTVVTAARRDAAQVVTILMTDGRANVARDGSGGRARAQEQALDSARRLASIRGDTVFIDTSARPDPFAAQLNAALRSRYVPLPSASAAGVQNIAMKVRANG